MVSRTGTLIIAMALLIGGCQSLMPVNPTGDLRGEALRVNNLLALTASQIGRAELNGYIDVSTEDRLYTQLEAAIIPPELIEVLDGNDATAEDRIKLAKAALDLIKAELLKATVETQRENYDG